MVKKKMVVKLIFSHSGQFVQSLLYLQKQNFKIRRETWKIGDFEFLFVICLNRGEFTFLSSLTNCVIVISTSYLHITHRFSLVCTRHHTATPTTFLTNSVYNFNNFLFHAAYWTIHSSRRNIAYPRLAISIHSWRSYRQSSSYTRRGRSSVNRLPVNKDGDAKQEN